MKNSIVLIVAIFAGFLSGCANTSAGITKAACSDSRPVNIQTEKVFLSHEVDEKVTPEGGSNSVYDQVREAFRKKNGPYSESAAVGVFVDADGCPLQTFLVDNNGDDLVAELEKAAMSVRYVPAKLKGEGVLSQTVFTMSVNAARR